MESLFIGNSSIIFVLFISIFTPRRFWIWSFVGGRERKEREEKVNK